MPEHAEIELKFLVPASQRAALAAELAARGTVRRVSLVDIYVDTPDQRLARAGLAWRMRREGRRWLQALKTAGSGALERFEHEVVRPEGTLDPGAHADTAPGRQLMALLAGEDAEPRFEIRQRRLLRRVRTRGAVVDVALDEGRLTAGAAVQPFHEIEFELVSGSPLALLGLVERWRHRFGLVYDPRNKAERGHLLASGVAHPPLRKAMPPRYARDASALHAFGAVFDECLAHLSRNAIGLAAGDPALRPEHVHQTRIAIRRLRSALRAFRGWVEAPPAELLDGLRALFAELGKARDSDVLDSGVAAELRQAGAPPLTLPADGGATDLAALIRSDGTQRLLLAWISWRTALQPLAASHETLKHRARRRLRRWHRGLVEACHRINELEPAALHELRKRTKRQRYAFEFFAPLLPRKHTARHLQVLSEAQQALGEISDLVAARVRYQGFVASDPAAWFAVGWVTARLDGVREKARGELARLAAVKPLPR